jgi:hypothetical protein
MLMYVVWEPSVPQRDRDGKHILSYPILKGTAMPVVNLSYPILSYPQGVTLFADSLMVSGTLVTPSWDPIPMGPGRLAIPDVG